MWRRRRRVFEWQFFAILIGLMYSLIALGFVLVYKATDAINFAQGEFVMIGGFIVAAGLNLYGAPLWLAIGGGVGGRVGFGVGLGGGGPGAPVWGGGNQTRSRCRSAMSRSCSARCSPRRSSSSARRSAWSSWE